MSYTVTDKFLRYVANRGFDTRDISFGYYDNDVTPSASSVYNDFDRRFLAELDDIRSGFPTITGSESSQPFRRAFSVGGERTVYGVLIWDDDDRRLLWAHRFLSPIFIADDEIKSIGIDFKRFYRQV